MNAKKSLHLLVIITLCLLVTNSQVLAASYQAACGTPFCYNGNHLIYANLFASKNCDHWSDKSVHGGIRRCDHQDPDQIQPTCHAGLGDKATTCWRYKSCSFLSEEAISKEATAPAEAALSAGFAEEFDTSGKHDKKDWVFEPDYALSAGENGYRCGKYAKMSPPWWQVFNGNIYARGAIEYQYPDTTDTSSATCDRGTQYVLAKLNSSDPNATVGLQMSEAESNLTDIANLRTQRDDPYQPNTIAAPVNFNQTTHFTQQNFNYFTSLLDFEQVANCDNSFSTINSGDDMSEVTSVCQTTSDVSNAADLVRRLTPYDINTSTNVLSPSVQSGQKIVIFVRGNLHIKSSIDVQTNGFLAFIVTGDIIFDIEFGHEIFDSNASNHEHLDGVYIAGGNITFTPRRIRGTDMDPFNDLPYCDKQAVLHGSFAALGPAGIQLTRTFKACFMMDPDPVNLIDYNCKDPSTIIQYRPDFLTSMPTWMKQPKFIRVEGV